MRAIAFALLAASLTIGETPADAAQNEGAGHGNALSHISGTIEYRERIALPPAATVTVRIDDATRADTSSPIAETTFVPNRQVPIPFRLSYSTLAVDRGHEYVARATISVDGRVRFTTLTAYPVITQGHPSHVDILLSGATATPGAPSLDSTAWRLASMEGQSLTAVPEDRLPYIQFDSATHALSGYSGCNRLVGTYVSNGSSLTIKPLGMTMMACPPTALSENDFTKALESVTSYSLDGGDLHLFHGGSPVATFTAFVPPGH